MSKLHFYIDGTPGGTDGIEVTELTFKNLKKFLRWATYNRYDTPLIFYLRFEKGYKGSVTLHSLYPYLYKVAFGTSFPSRQLTGVMDDITVNVTDTNYGILLSYWRDRQDTLNAKGNANIDIPLQDMLSFGFIEETA